MLSVPGSSVPKEISGPYGTGKRSLSCELVDSEHTYSDFLNCNHPNRKPEVIVSNSLLCRTYKQVVARKFIVCYKRVASV